MWCFAGFKYKAVFYGHNYIHVMYEVVVDGDNKKYKILSTEPRDNILKMCCKRQKKGQENIEDTQL